MNHEYKICTRCIMDTHDDPFITFDENGVCNHCWDYDKAVKMNVFSGHAAKRLLNQITNDIKKAGQKKDYDCVIGVSGGVDSTYTAYLVKKMGLRALLVHFDNGWNSELAVKNIEIISEKLGFDLYTYVVNWEEFKDLQLAYLKASVVDIEVPTDNGIFGALYKTAKENNIKYILTGSSITTEGFLPAHWNYHKFDMLNLHAIYKKYGTRQLKTFPQLGIIKKAYYEKVRGIKTIPILNYINYIKEDAKKILVTELGWKDYGYKHYESIFTRFYQGYILPEKFHIDKRKAHYSALIRAGQITREQALDELKNPPYHDKQKLDEDMQYVLKKLGLTELEFDQLMKAPARSHNYFPSFMNLYNKLKPAIKIYRQFFPRK